MMFKLSELPLELLYIICEHLDTEDLLVLARLNRWYSYHLAKSIGERIDRYVKEEGWRIHVTMLLELTQCNLLIQYILD